MTRILLLILMTASCRCIELDQCGMSCARGGGAMEKYTKEGECICHPREIR